ncbi:hypothetical protein EH240_27525 [Mesorhizobium tamadayense]|uniref:Uncharacterized protein n=2 Tax=Mesorhizobium tamadayense TaxID=425306 RepID=A0A3P3F6L2_9HYPH|nr:hypothetical protein EH240_27525 [Mesorhizobium tamadayense]
MVWWHRNLPFLATARNSSELRHDDNTVMRRANPDIHEDALLPHFLASMQAASPARDCGDFARSDDELQGVTVRFPSFLVTVPGSIRQPASLSHSPIGILLSGKKF